MKAELKKLEIRKSPTKSLIVLFMCLGVIQIIRTMKVKMFRMLSLYGLQVTTCTCSLKPIHKDRQEEKFTFDVSNYEKIFDELYKNGYIKMSHTIPPLEELKRQAYCKFYNTFCHATNDCSVLPRQIQLVVNEGRLVISQMQVDQTPFPVHTIELQNPKILIPRY